MNYAFIRKGFWRCRYGVATLWFSISLPSLTTAQGGFAKVSGKITDVQNIKVAAASVYAKPTDSKSGGKNRVTHVQGGQYLIDDLVQGKYNLVACGLPYRPDSHTVNLKPGDVKTQDFILREPHHAPRITLNIEVAREAGIDEIVYLKDPTSGCLVAQAPPDEKGEYQFTTWQTGDQVCVRNTKTEDYTCVLTLTTSP